MSNTEEKSESKVLSESIIESANWFHFYRYMASKTKFPGIYDGLLQKFNEEFTSSANKLNYLNKVK